MSRTAAPAVTSRLSGPRSGSSGLSVTAVLVTVAGALVVGCMVSLTDPPALARHELEMLGVLVTLVAVGNVLRLRLPGDRDVAPIGSAVALAMAIVPAVGQTPVRFTVAVVVVGTLVGMVVGILPHALVGRAPALDVPAREIVVVTLGATLFRVVPWPGIGVPDLALGRRGVPGWQVAVATLSVAAVVTAANVVLAAVVQAGRLGIPLRTALRDEVDSGLALTAAVGISGVLVALAARPMDLLAVPVFAVPLLVTQFAFRRYVMVRTTYRQSLRSLARLPELASYTQTLHSERVAALSVLVGRRLGLRERDLDDLETAARLHDIGQLSLPAPLVGGATSRLDAAQARRIAEDGAAVVRQGGVMGQVAAVVEHQADPYRRAGVDGPAGDETVPVGARVLRVVNAYDDMVGQSTDATVGRRALEQLRLGTGEDYDPVVVDALDDVLRRDQR